MRKGLKFFPLLSAVGILVLSTGCDRLESQNNSEPKRAKAILSPTQNSKVRGEVVFKKEPEGIRIIANVTGLTPGKHGFHIHEKGDCSAPDASSAGAHFNPTHAEHGSPFAENRHVGDLGNLEADLQGIAYYNRLDTKVAFAGESSIIGRSVVVHADPDDFKTQPTGNSGGRLACGVIAAVD